MKAAKLDKLDGSIAYHILERSSIGRRGNWGNWEIVWIFKGGRAVIDSMVDEDSERISWRLGNLKAVTSVMT